MGHQGSIIILKTSRYLFIIDRSLMLLAGRLFSLIFDP